MEAADIKLIDTLRNRLADYKKSDHYKNKILKQDILSIEIAVCLFEMALFCQREINEDDKYWFQGGFYIANDITGDWEDIAIMYEKLAKVVLEKR